LREGAADGRDRNPPAVLAVGAIAITGCRAGDRCARAAAQVIVARGAADGRDRNPPAVLAVGAIDITGLPRS